jgi:uncharacterized protein (TIGR01777 family)
MTEALLERGDEVAGLTRDPSRAGAAQPGVRWHEWEPNLERPPREALAGVEAVVNLVGAKIDQRWTDEAKAAIRDSRITATRNLVDAITGLEEKPRVLVSQSAIGFYGDRGDEVLTETSPPGDDFAADVVRDWEQEARKIEGGGVRLAIPRTGLVLNEGEGLLKRMLPPFKLGVGGPLAGGRQYMPWIHVADWTGIVLWALDDDEVEGVVNATAPEPVTNREFSKALGRVLRRPALIPVPGIAVDAMLGREAAEHTAKSSARVVPRRTQELGYSFKFPDLEPALRDVL